jgi:hypothetical protein
MRKVFNKRIRRRSGGVDLAADINGVIAVNTGEGEQETVSSNSRTRVVQRSRDAKSARQNEEER